MADESSQLTSTKPYLVRAIHEWILDNGLTPHLIVDARFPETRVPQEHVNDGQIVLNLSPGAVHQLVLGNDWIQFAARFGGMSRELAIPTEAVLGIIARENGQGLFFPPTGVSGRAGDRPDAGACTRGQGHERKDQGQAARRTEPEDREMTIGGYQAPQLSKGSSNRSTSSWMPRRTRCPERRPTPSSLKSNR